MKKTAYTYTLINSYRETGKTIEWIRIWFKQSAKGYKYKFYPIILTYTNKVGLYVEKKFKSFQCLKDYLQIA